MTVARIVAMRYALMVAAIATFTLALIGDDGSGSGFLAAMIAMAAWVIADSRLERKATSIASRDRSGAMVE